MITRWLPPEDLDRIAGSDLARVWATLPSGGRILVCEHEGRVLGHLALLPFWHVEGIAIDPAVAGFARGVVLRQLLDAMHATARSWGVRTVFPAAADPQMVSILERLHAVEIPARWFALSVKES